jgi:anti-sigma regulatory factor (Ser/Thr protein kinase)
VEAAAVAAPLARDLWLLGDPSQLGAARRFAQDAAAAFGFDDDETYAFTFAVNEAVSNAIEHGEPFEDGTIRLRIHDEGHGLTFSVLDRGSFTPNSPRKVDGVADRGRGLAFMAAMVDDLQVKPMEEGTLVRLTKRRVAIA